MSLYPFVIRRGKRYSWRREIRGITIQVPLFTDDPKIARTIAAVVTATSVQAYKALADGRVDRRGARAMIEQAARIEAARQTLRSARSMWFSPFPYESAAMLRIGIVAELSVEAGLPLTPLRLRPRARSRQCRVR